MKNRSNSYSVYEYAIPTFTHHTPALEAAHQASETRRAGMQVSALEGKILNLLVRLKQPRHLLEIGTFMGYSTLWMASALPEAGRITTLEADATHAAHARNHLAEAPVTLIEMPALAWLRSGAPATLPPIEMVFVDAVKQEYLEYLLAVEPYLAKGALVVGDNTLLFGAMMGEAEIPVSKAAISAMQAFNARLADASLYDGVMLPTNEGMSVGIWRG